MGKLLLGKLVTGKVSVGEISGWGNCCWRSCDWGNCVGEVVLVHLLYTIYQDAKIRKLRKVESISRHKQIQICSKYDCCYFLSFSFILA